MSSIFLVCIILAPEVGPAQGQRFIKHRFVGRCVRLNDMMNSVLEYIFSWEQYKIALIKDEKW